MYNHISIHAPRGGATSIQLGYSCGRVISIHAPRGGSDPAQNQNAGNGEDFNPRSPWGERLVALVLC